VRDAWHTASLRRIHLNCETIALFVAGVPPTIGRHLAIARSFALTFVSRSAGTRTAADHRSNPSCAIWTAREPARWRGSLNGVTPAGFPLIETEAPDGTEVIDRVPTNAGCRAVVGASPRSGDGRTGAGAGAETSLSRLDRGPFAITALLDAGRISWFVAVTTGVEI
jgi:hypothetical protein